MKHRKRDRLSRSHSPSSKSKYSSKERSSEASRSNKSSSLHDRYDTKRASKKYHPYTPTFRPSSPKHHRHHSPKRSAKSSHHSHSSHKEKKASSPKRRHSRSRHSDRQRNRQESEKKDHAPPSQEKKENFLSSTVRNADISKFSKMCSEISKSRDSKTPPLHRSQEAPKKVVSEPICEPMVEQERDTNLAVKNSIDIASVKIAAKSYAFPVSTGSYHRSEQIEVLPPPPMFPLFPTPTPKLLMPSFENHKNEVKN